MAGPEKACEGFVGPTFDADVSVNDRYQGFKESKWCETVNENLDEEHDPSLADDGTDKDDESKRSDAARGYKVKSLNSSDSS